MQHHPPGWHGKLPTLGDFASRRMDTSFLAAWDTWLAEGMLALRQQQPDTWLDAYLASPSWRFLLMPGVMPGDAAGAPGTNAWAGVLMPSVDRVGRYFPFSLVWPLPALPGTAEQQRALWAWLARLDDLAADALHDDWTVDRLEDELARMALPVLAPAALAAGARPAGLPARPGAWLDEPLTQGGDVAGHLASQAQALWLQQVQGLALWHASAGAAATGLRTSRGLPASASALLGATITGSLPSATPP